MSRNYHQLRPKRTRGPEVASSACRSIFMRLSWQRWCLTHQNGPECRTDTTDMAGNHIYTKYHTYTVVYTMETRATWFEWSNDRQMTKHIIHRQQNILNTLATRQSEMANTSPCHIPVLGDVPPIKIETFDLLSWRHFSARSIFYIFNWLSYPSNCDKKYLIEIVGQVFEINAIESLGSMSTDEAWRHLRYYITFAYGIHIPTWGMYAKVCND